MGSIDRIQWKSYPLLVLLYLNVNRFCIGIGRNMTDMDYFSNKTDHHGIHSHPRMERGHYSKQEAHMQPQVIVPDTDDFQCQTDRDCSNGFNTLTSQIVCQNDHTCGCLDSCLTYTYTVYGIHAVFEFYCGECGQLGSECEGDDDCDYPGLCSRKDHFCHCPIGEHKDNICIVFDTHFLGSMMVFAFGIFGITIICGCSYQCFLGYRLYGNWRWWRNIPNWRRRRQTQPPMGPSKSPAFTTTLNMWNITETPSEGASSELHLQDLPSTSSGIRGSLRRSTASTINHSRTASKTSNTASLSSSRSSHSGREEAAIKDSNYSHWHSPSISTLNSISEENSHYL